MHSYQPSSFGQQSQKMKLKKIKTPCPLCNHNTLVEVADLEHRFKYLKKEHAVKALKRTLCQTCGSSFQTPSQSLANKDAIESFTRELVGELGPREILALRERYSISQADATKIFQCGPKNFSKWERGEVAPTGATALLLKAALELPKLMQHLAAKAGIEIYSSDTADRTTTRASIDTREAYNEQFKAVYEAGRRAGLVQQVNIVMQTHSDLERFAEVEFNQDMSTDEILWQQKKNAQQRQRVLN